ncbi:site-specific integrase [Nonomuraea sp. SBT364]|uniref:site-specific integrase n=1 Tax=Nonomuraea sp. SBT364 TaxID=1580530 RepID=UPI00069F242A|nr:site-specific integrase [Nonomuraea sp. SBT364]
MKPEAESLVFTGIQGWAHAPGDRRPGLHFHDLPHTRNTIAADTAAGLKDIMARMGHDNVRAAMIYKHAVREADKLITKAIDKHLIGYANAHATPTRTTAWPDGSNRVMARRGVHQT